MPETETRRPLMSVMVTRETHAELDDIRIGISRRESRRATMDEVVRQLLENQK